MAQWTQQYRSAWGMYQQFNDNKCINDFANFKDGIEQKISAIGKNTPNDFCKECVKLRKSIIEKDREFKECYARRSKKLNLIEDNVDIKRFIGECITFRQCYSNRSARNKQVPSKSANAGRCEKDGRCNNGNAQTGGMGSKEQQRLATETPKTGSSPRQKSQSTKAEPAEGKDSKQQTIVSQTRTIANTLPNHVTTQHGGSESVNNHHLITSEQVETSISPSTVSSHKSTTEEDNRAFSTIPVSRSDQKSNPGIPLEQRNTNIDPIQKNSPDDPSDGNTTGGRDTSEQSVVRQVLAGQDVVTETRDSAVPAGKDFGQTDPSEANADGLEPASADTGVVAATHVDIGNPNSDTVITDSDNSYNAVHGKVVDHDKTSSRDEGIKNSASESSAEIGTTHGNISTGGGDHTKGSNVNDAGIETHNNAKSCMETPCSNEQSTQLNAHNSEKLGIFNHISKVLLENQGHMINASIPMGIVMLLTLLFKYTPLWRIFTKRKRNKRSHMNEKLQRVLQQPSIEREERSVPFSYSAFEYSS
ncbi:PIR protein [Plasmodium vivax]|nr:PIR protein [Plasmodium vivax]